MRNYFKKVIYLIAVSAVSFATAGAFDDFFTAIRRDDGAAIERLLRRGFDPNTRDANGQPPLVLAIREDSGRAIEALLAAPKINVELRNPKDESPLMLAAIKGQLTLAERLIARGADINKTGWTPLHYAATNGHLRLMRLLLEQHAYIDAESPNGTTPLMMAAQYGTADAVRLLLEEGADPTLRNQKKLTALDFAHTSDRPEVTELIAGALRKRLPKGSW